MIVLRLPDGSERNYESAITVEKAVKGDMFSIPTHEIIRRGDKLYKIKDAEI